MTKNDVSLSLLSFLLEISYRQKEEGRALFVDKRNDMYFYSYITRWFMTFEMCEWVQKMMGESDSGTINGKWLVDFSSEIEHYFQLKDAR